MSSSAQVPVSQGQLGVSYSGIIWPELRVPEGAGPDHRAGRPQYRVWGDGLDTQADVHSGAAIPVLP